MNINFDANAMADTVMSIARPASQHILNAAQAQTEAVFVMILMFIGAIAIGIVLLLITGSKTKSRDTRNVSYIFATVLTLVWLMLAASAVGIRIAPEYQTLKNIKRLIETNSRR